MSWLISINANLMINMICELNNLWEVHVWWIWHFLDYICVYILYQFHQTWHSGHTGTDFYLSARPFVYLVIFLASLSPSLGLTERVFNEEHMKMFCVCVLLLFPPFVLRVCVCAGRNRLGVVEALPKAVLPPHEAPRSTLHAPGPGAPRRPGVAAQTQNHHRSQTSTSVRKRLLPNYGCFLASRPHYRKLLPLLMADHNRTSIKERKKEKPCHSDIY